MIVELKTFIASVMKSMLKNMNTETYEKSIDQSSKNTNRFGKLTKIPESSIETSLLSLNSSVMRIDN